MTTAISEEQGVMLSVVTGHARATASHVRVSPLRREALTAATSNMCAKLVDAISRHDLRTS